MRVTRHGLDTAVDALRAVLPLEKPADAVLHQFFRDHAKLSQNERGFIADAVFGVLRRRRLIDHLMLKAGQTKAAPGSKALHGPRHMILAWLAKVEGLNARELEPGLSESEAKWVANLKAVSLADLSLAEQAELPDWLSEKLSGFMNDDDIVSLGRGLMQPAPLDIRVNTLLAERDEVLRLLQADGLAAEPTPYSPIGIRVQGRPPLNRHPLFAAGKIEVQDESSQLIGFVLAPKRRSMVVDFCAGGGGKTLLLGAMMQSQGRLYALDVSEKRLANLKQRLKRSGLSNVHPQLIQNENDIKIKRLTGKIDSVLVDAPCSGVGTLRRNPDLKWRQSPAGLDELRDKQRAILQAASALLKKGGRLVYATCSFLPEENQDIVAAFLDRNSAFRLLGAAELLARNGIALDTGEYFQLLPHTHATDGFFAAALEKTD
ncbi:MAG: RsmB/NOP family class I SAM-dependent RNA methyltransferase [Burkholderiales bacterium]|nr:RsmB/NOP family class I SAM-dependent RNA methyltransferase [Burkholderiales bacterium]MDQ3196565.1 RsmB/NOP family class I SAM-dependent RNA methyltransferase [Pseudomonadota bacterium]